ncbi:MAG TPA: sulfite exporter TauE/SafE family protein [Beijerinckiaceae bacterium]|nr:sulfite exporter TauE/SafE family protein [Beijerinckiaceae bacterium]
MDVEFLLIVVGALGLGGFIKGATGLGLPLVSVPALAAFLGVPHALAIVCIPLVVTNAWQSWHFSAHRHGTGFLARLLPASVVGIGLGTVALTTLPGAALSLALAVMMMAYIAFYLTKPDLRLSPGSGRRLAPLVGLVAGALQASTGISAPVSITFIHALRLARPAFVFAVAAMFLGFAVAQVVALAVAGIMTWTRFLEGLIALVPIALAMPLGAWAASFLSRETFDRLILGILGVMSLKLFHDGITGL